MGCCLAGGRCWNQIYFLYLGVPFLLISTLLAVTAISAPYWRAGDNYQEGLYYKCVNDSCSQLDDLDYGGGDEGWWRLCQVCCPIMVACGLVASGLTVSLLLKRRSGEEVGWTGPNLIMALGITAGCLSIAINLAYRLGVMRKDYPPDNHLKEHFCFSFTNATSPLFILGGVYVRQHRWASTREDGGGSNCQRQC